MRIFELFAKPKHKLEVLEKLHDLGITEFPPNPEGHRTRKKPGARIITRQIIDEILRNSVYAGDVPAPRETNLITEDIKPDLMIGEQRYFKSVHAAVVPTKLWK